MFVSIVQSLTTLLVGGAALYVFLVKFRPNQLTWEQRVFVGLVSGALVIVLGMDSFLLEGLRAPLDAKSGPLVFAGYLGGPIAGFIAGACGAAYRISLGSPSPGPGIFMNLAIPVVGMAVARFHPPRDWPTIPVSAVGSLLAGFLVLHLVPLVYLGVIAPVPGGIGNAVTLVLAFTVVGVLSILLTWKIIDLTARFARQGRELDEQKRQLDLFLSHSAMGMLEFDPKDGRMWADAGLASIYGFGDQARFVSGEEWITHIHPEDRAWFLEELQNFQSGDAHHKQVDFRALGGEGQQLNVRGNWIAKRNEDGSVARIVALNRDLTDIREAEQRHLETAEQLSVIVEELPGVVFQTHVNDDGSSSVQYISPKCVEIWGYTDAEFYADQSLFIQAHDPEDFPVFVRKSQETIATGAPMHHRYRITARDGQSRWVEFRGNARKRDGYALFESIVLDVTREVEAEQQLKKEREIAHRAQKNESIGHLTGGVAHDFNNLLAVVLGNLEMLAEEEDPEIRQQLTDAAIAATLRGADLTRNMLAFARKARLDPVVFDLNDVVREAKNWIGRTLPESISVETSLLAGLWKVEADLSSLESAFLNLVLNARDAMDGKGRLTIETANVRIDEGYIDSRQEELDPGRYVMLAISDTGHGIAREDLGSIFEPFFTTKAPGVGTGLGLSMVFGFMRQSGGTVQVYSEVGEGTTFKLYFPVSQAQESAQVTLVEPALSETGSRRRILLVEDNEGVRTTMEFALERAGYHVTSAESGDAALLVFQADPGFDLVLTDIVMPGELQGTTLSRRLRDIRYDLPVVFMSGYANEATVHGNGLRPEDIRLMKPVQRSDLLAAIAKALANGHGRTSSQ